MASVTLDKLRKVYPNGHVGVADATFEVVDGELLVLVGPSGCGKSTLLRMIAGLEGITSGTLRIGERVVNDVAPKDRDIAMVFQSYALYPHMSVGENLAFGLKLRGHDKASIAQRVGEAAKMLELDELLDRKPAALSGGQRQRVALGRALVRQPQVFLLDEPLSNLDAKLRMAMRIEIARLHRRLGTTMVYVTHDQVEAMTLGQRIVVLKDGEIQQIDTPMALYNRPANVFVAGFLGSPRMNLLRGRLEAGAGGGAGNGSRVAGTGIGAGADTGVMSFALANGSVLPLPAGPELLASLQAHAGRELVIGLRPEDLHPGDADVTRLAARVEVVEPVGNEAFINLDCAGTELVVRLPPHPLPLPGDVLHLGFAAERMHVFDGESGERIV